MKKSPIGAARRAAAGRRAQSASAPAAVPSHKTVKPAPAKPAARKSQPATPKPKKSESTKPSPTKSGSTKSASAKSAAIIPKLKPTKSRPDKPVAPKPKASKPGKKVAIRMLREDRRRLDRLKLRAAAAGRRSKRSELMRAGLRLLQDLDPQALCAALDALPRGAAAAPLLPALASKANASEPGPD